MASPVKKRKRTPCFRIEFSGDDDKKAEILGKMQSIRSNLSKKLNKPIGNLQVLDTLFEMWSNQEGTVHYGETCAPSMYIKAEKRTVNQKIFMCAEESLKRFLKVVDHHSKQCKNCLKIQKIIRKGHVIKARLQCEEHKFLWSSSPYLPNKRYLVNDRIQHGFVCSGMLPSHYSRFVEAAKIGQLSKQRRSNFFTSYKSNLEDVYNESISTALLEEIGSYEDERLGSIDIMTDARHGWRKNAKDTSVVAIGDETHKVLSCQHITKADDIVSQRHEKVGTERIYNYLSQQDVTVGVHTHDRNLSINKYIREECDSENQNDTWHSAKSFKNALKKITAGTMASEGKTWSFQLNDKVQPVSTHVQWAIRNCNGDANKLRTSLENVVEHYKNNHSSCHQSSRCKMDPKYELSRIGITNPKAEKLLLQTITNSNIYKHAEDYRLGKGTSYVESFNNVLNVYQDKRISFTDDQYNMRAFLAVCHWNENVDREFTSVWKPNADHRATKGKKNYKKCTFHFRENIWNRYIETVFKKNRKRKKKNQ